MNHPTQPHMLSPRVVVVIKLCVDSKGRIFIAKQAREVLRLCPNDELVIMKEQDEETFLIYVQRNNRVTTSWKLEEEKNVA